MSRTAATSADPYAYLKWPRLIVFNLNGALSIIATGLAAQCESPLVSSLEKRSRTKSDPSSAALVNVNHDKAQLVSPSCLLPTSDGL